MNAGEELISIIVPVYNAGNYIEETIHMVEKQTYRTWELILVDDHSADDSRKIIENYLKTCNGQSSKLNHSYWRNKLCQRQSVST